MKEFYKYVLTNTQSGKIDKETSLKILNMFNEKTKKEDIAIIGLSYKFPDADNKDLLDNVLNGLNSFKELDNHRKEQVIKYFNSSDQSFNGKFSTGSFLSDIDKFDYNFFKITPREANLMDPSQRLFMQTAYHALEDAGYSGDNIKGTLTGIYLGYATFVQGNYGKMIYDVDSSELANGMVGNIPSLIPSRISYALNLKGPAITLDTACSSSLVALHTACEGIRNGDCNMAIVGGLRLNMLPIENDNLSIGVESSDGMTRAFDETSDGAGVGEGVGVVILKPLSKAKKDRDRILAVIKGSAMNQDGTSIGITAPNADSQENVMVQAWKNSGINPETLGFIETHGTGTPLGDSIEVDGITRAFRQFTKKNQICAVTNIKSNIGHLFEASGMAGLIKCILALNEKVIPPTTNFIYPNTKIDFAKSPIYINTKVRPWLSEVRRCGLSSFGLSGTNCHFVLEEPPEIKENNCNISTNLFTVSAKSKVSLKRYLDYIRDYVNSTEINLDSFCYTMNNKDHFNYRIACAVKSIEDLRYKLESIDIDNYDYTKEIYYGKNKIVTSSKKELSEGELTLRDVEILNKELKDKMKINSNSNSYEIVDEIAKLYVKGASVGIQDLYENKKINKIVTPLYPFDEKECWIPFKERNLFSVKWTEEVLPQTKSDVKKLLYISDKGYLDDLGLLEKYEKFGVDIRRTDFKESLEDINEDEIIIDLCDLNYKFTPDPEECVSVERMSLIYELIQRICKYSKRKQIHITLVADNAYKTKNEEVLKVDNAAILSLSKIIGKDVSNIKINSIDIDENTTGDCVYNLINKDNKNYITVIRDGKYYVESFGTLDEFDEEDIKISNAGVYIITGGIGGIGLSISKYLCKNRNINLILLTRREFPDSSKWSEMLKDNNTDEITSSKLRDLLEIKEQAASLNIVSCDVNNYDDLRRVLEKARKEFGKINGIVHGAGFAKDLSILDREEGINLKVLCPKVNGTINLHRATLNDNLDFFIMFSSVATVFSALGQSDYIMANSFMDEFVNYRKALGLKAKTVNWCTWKDKGMAHDSGFTVDTIFKAMMSDKAVEGFDNAFNKDVPRVIIGYLNQPAGLNFLAKSNVKLHGTIKSMLDSHLEKMNNKKQKKISSQSSGFTLTGRNNNEYSDVELKIGRIFSEILGFEEIDIYDNFYELGLDSISGIKITERLSKEFNMQLSAVDVLKNTSIIEFSEFINNELGESESDSNKVEEKDIDQVNEIQKYYPLSPSQRGLFLLDTVQEKSTNYNVANVVVINENFEFTKLNKAMQDLVNRHEALRTSFHNINGELVQQIHDDVDFQVEYEEMTEEYAVKNKQKLFDEFVRPFDLSKAPLIRMKVINVDNKRSVLMYDIHHIITDGISNEIIVRDFLALYKGEELKKLNYSYKEYCLWYKELLASDKLLKQEKRLLEKFSGDLPLIDMPTDYQRGSIQQFDGDHVFFKVDRETSSKLKEVCKNNEATLYMVLLAALDILLYKYTNQKDIIIGSPIVGRNNENTKNIVGMFVNTIVLRNNINPDMTFAEFLKSVKDSTFEAYENQDYPFSSLVEKLNGRRDLSRNPVFDIMFVLQNYGISKSGQEFFDTSSFNEDTFLSNKASKFDISLSAVEDDGEIVYDIEYCSKLFKKSTMERFSKNLINLLKILSGESKIKIKDIDLLDAEERKAVTKDFNSNIKSFDKEDDTVTSVFNKIAEEFKDKTALIYKNQKLTYGEFNEKSNKLANYLRKSGALKENIIAIIQDKSIEMMISMMAVMKSGAAYLPIDPDYPEERIKYMLEDSNCNYILVNSNNNLNMKLDDKKVIDISSIDFDSLNEEITDISSPEDLFYVIYTSGSTGKPKGVMVEQKNVLAFVRGFYSEFGKESTRVMLQQYSYAFDGFVEEAYTTLLSGSTLVLADKMDVLDMNKLSDIIECNNVNSISVSAVLFNELGKNLISDKIKLVISGGDVLKRDYINNYNDNITLVNSYGPTETTCCATYCKINRFEKQDIPIGKPLLNYKIYVLDENLLPLPIGTPGEIYIGGDGVGRGYLNNDELTKNSFISSPFDEGRLYKTGDLGKWSEDGNIYFLGRIDRQIKIRGFRIEISEVERNIKSYPKVNEVVVTARQNDNGEKQLCCYLTSSLGINIKDIKKYLNRKMPEYMIPSYFVRLDSIPYTANGKVDVLNLPEPSKDDSVTNVYVAPRSEVEVLLADIWKEVLNVTSVGIEDNFFDLGGNSIKAIEVLSKIIEKGFVIGINTIFENQDIESLAKAVSLCGGDYIKERFNYLKNTVKSDIEERAKNFENDKEIQLKAKNYLTKVKKTKLFKLSNTEKFEDILLTGSTGYLGVYILRELLINTWSNIHLIVRGKDKMNCVNKVRDNIIQYFSVEFFEENKDRLFIYQGDVSEENFGIDEETYEYLASTVQCIVNSAGLIKHYGEYDEFLNVNLGSIKNCVILAKHGIRKIINHVSTISVGSGIIKDKPYDYFTEYDVDINQKGDNNYVESKIECEKYIEKERENGIIINVFRPGNITFRSTDGVFQRNIGENAFYNMISAVIGLGFVPDINSVTLDFSYVDYVAKAIVLLFNRTALFNQNHHICNEYQVNMLDLAKMFTDVGYKVEVLDVNTFFTFVEAHMNDEKYKKYIDYIILNTGILDSLNNSTDIEVNQDRTLKYLKHLGFEWKCIDRTLVDKMMNYCNTSGFINKK